MSDAQMKLFLNDPTIPDLFEMVPAMDMPQGYPNVYTIGYVGPRTDVGTSPWRAAQAYYTVINGLKAMQPTLPAPVTNWARTDRPLILLNI